MAELDGIWNVVRVGGLLPPLIGVRKRIAGTRGETRVGGLVGVPFRVEGRVLRYLPPFAGFVDWVEPDGDRFRGRATFLDREFGRFVMTRVTEAAHDGSVEDRPDGASEDV
jgi:hypothetical protein